jgi:hypothetical protein
MHLNSQSSLAGAGHKSKKTNSGGSQPRQARADKQQVVGRIRDALNAGEYAEAREVLRRVGRDLLSDPRRLLAMPATTFVPRRLVFICGLHRSGTSLLEHHLSAHYGAVRLRAAVPENEGQFLQDVFPLEQPFGGPGFFAFYPQMTLERISDPHEARTAQDRILRSWEPWIEGEGNVLIEKSPPNLIRIPYLRSVFPGARFVVWSRDPRVVAASTQRWTPTALPLLMQHWNVAYMKAIDSLEGDCILASYEEFCDDPKGTMGRIAEFCELQPRTTPLDLPPRFATIRNGNGKYLSNFPKYWNRAKVKAWEIFGYDF